jgi:tetratricopeptide (TPR) repeat protein
MQDPWPDRCRASRPNSITTLAVTRSALGLAAVMLVLGLVTSGCESLNYPEADETPAETEPPGEGHMASEIEPGAWVPLSRAGRNALRMRDYPAAEQNYVAALAETSELPGYDTRVRAALGNVIRMAAAYQRQDQWEDADRLVDLVALNAQRDRRADYEAAEPVFVRQARHRRSNDRLLDAIALYEATLQLWNADAAQHENTRLQNEHSIAMAYLAADQPAQAAPRLERIVDAAVRIFGPGSRQTAAAYFDLATAYEAEGRFSEAEAAYMRSLEIGEAIDPDALDLAMSRNQVASFYSERDRNEEAMALAGLAVAALEAKGVAGAPLAAALDTLALAQTRLGRTREAEANFKRAITARDQMDPASRHQLDAVLENYAALLRSLDRPEEANALEAKIGAEGKP